MQCQHADCNIHIHRSLRQFPVHSFHRTATADGQYMAKILSTFSKMEQSRFEAFKRVSFPCNAISRYVAHCLAERQQHQRQVHDETNPNAKKRFAASNHDGTSEPRLQDLVVPGQEEEITTVVATLAKAYAQRLCAAAKTHAQVQKQQQQEQQGGVTTGGGGDGNGAEIKPEHVLQAFYARKQQGQDPGFFLQANECITVGAHNATTGKEQMKRVAALSAQDDFDRTFDEYKEFLKRSPPQENNKSTKVAPKKDDSDSSSGEEEEVEMDMEAELEKEMAS